MDPRQGVSMSAINENEIQMGWHNNQEPGAPASIALVPNQQVEEHSDSDR